MRTIFIPCWLCPNPTLQLAALILIYWRFILSNYQFKTRRRITLSNSNLIHYIQFMYISLWASYWKEAFCSGRCSPSFIFEQSISLPRHCLKLESESSTEEMIEPYCSQGHLESRTHQLHQIETSANDRKKQQFLANRVLAKHFH